MRLHKHDLITTCQVTGNAREIEIARMATGNLETSAGTNLARALLAIDYNKYTDSPSNMSSDADKMNVVLQRSSDVAADEFLSPNTTTYTYTQISSYLRPTIEK